jgi:SAM-dependent methyltransferase
MNCTVCGSPALTESFRENLDIVGVGAVAIGYGMCLACSHIQQTTPVPQDKLDSYYATIGSGAQYFGRDKTTDRLLSMIGLISGGPASVYEVGCGNARHFEHIGDQFFRDCTDLRVSGCEPSDSAVHAAMTKGFVVDHGLESDWLPKQADLGLIIYSGVLEHLPDPVGSLRRANQALADTGHLLIEVPCAVAPQALPPGWFAFEHLSYFSYHTAIKMLGAAGFKPVEVRVNYTDFIYPVITILAQKGPVIDPTGGFEFIDQTQLFIGEYLRRDRAFWERTARIVEDAKCAINIWGAGIHTSQLFYRVPVARERCGFIVDSDPNKWGCLLGGLPIISPERFAEAKTPAPVLISSYFSEASIIQSPLLKGKKVICLYENPL